MKKTAVLFPGIGYNSDRPLLYYARKLITGLGFGEILPVTYHFSGGNIRGSEEKMREAFDALYSQAETALSGVSWEKYGEILFISKSIGTAVAAAYAEKHRLKARHILYTPLKETFLFHPRDAVAFIGTKDPWSDPERIRDLCHEADIPVSVIRDADHSLETGDPLADIGILLKVMEETKRFMNGDRS